MNIDRINKFCDVTLADVIGDLYTLRDQYFMVEYNKAEERKEFIKYLMTMVDQRIAEMKDFVKEAKQELASQKDL